ncbi:MAG TPA: type II toxin-antitoxin system PrlF family antitoxin [Longimicrobium sp.]|nr:type II toxin-antitoxin system PrlF family antitoxin [Longimicrobium sp.]
MLRSNVTARSQTTLPNGVRKALGIHPGRDGLEWQIRGDEAIVRRAPPVVEEDEDDPVLTAFLAFIENDITLHPERLQAMPESLYHRLLAVTEGVEVDLDEPIEGPIAL